MPGCFPDGKALHTFIRGYLVQLLAGLWRPLVAKGQNAFQTMKLQMVTKSSLHNKLIWKNNIKPKDPPVTKNKWSETKQHNRYKKDLLMAADERCPIRIFTDNYLHTGMRSCTESRGRERTKKREQTKVTSVHASTSSPDSPHSAW